MRRFIRTVVPSEGYKEVIKVGEKYVVHLDPTNSGDESITCFECMTDEEPDMEVLTEELATWKAYLAEKELETAKAVRVQELEAYDTSSAVNSFSYGGVEMWLDKATRVGLLLRINAEQAAGESTTTLWFGTMSFEIPIASAFQMLYAIERYASGCYDKTAAHKAAINSLSTVDAVANYDFTVGYPEKLTFSV